MWLWLPGNFTSKLKIGLLYWLSVHLPQNLPQHIYAGVVYSTAPSHVGNYRPVTILLFNCFPVNLVQFTCSRAQRWCFDVCTCVFQFLRCSWLLWLSWKVWWWGAGLSSGFSGLVQSGLCLYCYSSSWWQRFGRRTETTMTCWEWAGRPQPERSDGPSSNWRSPCTPTKTLYVTVRNHKWSTLFEPLIYQQNIKSFLLGRPLSSWQVPASKSSLWSFEGWRSQEEIW